MGRERVGDWDVNSGGGISAGPKGQYIINPQGIEGGSRTIIKPTGTKYAESKNGTVAFTDNPNSETARNNPNAYKNYQRFLVAANLNKQDSPQTPPKQTTKLSTPQPSPQVSGAFNDHLLRVNPSAPLIPPTPRHGPIANVNGDTFANQLLHVNPSTPLVRQEAAPSNPVNDYYMGPTRNPNDPSNGSPLINFLQRARRKSRPV